MSDQAPLELVSFKLCPFVQRSVIVLLEKDVDFTITYIDLKNKPDWFMKISPMGKVPVLRVGDDVLFESAVIAEYLDETRPPRMHPDDPLQRARNRAWIEFSSELLMTQFRMLMSKDQDGFDQMRAALGDKLATLEAFLGEGPFFNGDHFALVDSAFAPGFMRLVEVEKWYALESFEGLPKVKRFAEVLLERPSVRDSVVPDFTELFRGYLVASGSWFGGQLS